MFICLKKKPPRHVENVIMMFNQAGFSDNANLSLKMHLLAQAAFLQCAIFMVAHVYSYINDAVTFLNNNFSITH